ncbi:FAD/NAD(P)-binding domain-containing protein [Tuber magnatum]|uniref:FAD/NAD(P)-binding domain-containing protein n=1 Tax=Tuber magnatum TaxID=42249 RepID=A0A317ST63_9PEZI|nr:FAD/NAD(P)-binding domain-containing protein [Tuber magnatum]
MAPPHADDPHSAGPTYPPNWIPVAEKPLHTPKRLRIVTVGAGHSGLMLAYKIRDQFKYGDFVDHVIYEKNHDIGGTWLENRYPGVACDVPAHIYTFSWEPNPDWSEFYVGGEEIFQYIKRTAAKYDLARDVIFNSKVVEAIWNQGRGKWELKIEQEGRFIWDECDIFINASGILNKWKWPSIKGINSFKGHLVHSAKWEDNYDFAGKRVGVIGNGSSAIQIVPKLQKVAGHLVNFMRTPTWISATYSSEFLPDGKNFYYTEEQKAEFRNNPKMLAEYRKKIENGFNKFFYALLNDSPAQAAVTEQYTRIMSERLGNDPELIKKFIPSWRVGCRRLSPGEGYLEALHAPNVQYTWDAIERITEKGIVTSAGEIELDAIVCATGFDVSFMPQWRMRGLNGSTLDKWRDDPEGYLGIFAPNMPNYFIVNGPNCPVGHGSLLSVMEWTIEYIIRWAKKMASEDIKAVMVKPDVVREWNAYAQEYLKRTVWTSGCRSWYKNGKIDGKVTATYPGSVIHYREVLETIRGEDFDIQYSEHRNRFGFMGNGLAALEMNEDADLAFYMYK